VFQVSPQSRKPATKREQKREGLPMSKSAVDGAFTKKATSITRFLLPAKAWETRRAHLGRKGIVKAKTKSKGTTNHFSTRIGEQSGKWTYARVRTAKTKN